MSPLSSIIRESPKPQHSFLLLLSSIAQSSLPLLRQLLSSKGTSNNTGSSRCLLFCFSYPVADLLESFPSQPDFIEVHDYVARIPGYDVHWPDLRETISSVIRTSEQHHDTDSPDSSSTRPSPPFWMSRCHYRLSRYTFFRYRFNTTDIQVPP